MDQDVSIPSTPIDVLENKGSAQKYIRTYERDMATVQRGGTPDLVPLAPAAGATPSTTTDTGIPAIPFTPVSPPVVPPQNVEPTLPVPRPIGLGTPSSSARLPTHTPQEAVVTTYQQGFNEGAERANENIPTSPAAVAWQAERSEREAILARLEEKARAEGLPTAPSLRAQQPSHRTIEVEMPPAVPIAPPAGALSVPSYAPTFTLGVPGEPVPPPPPLPEPAPPEPPQLPPDFTPSTLPGVSPLHTYATDFSDHVASSQAGATSILAAEADARRGPLATPQKEAPHSRRNTYIAIGLIVLGVGGLFAAYARFVRNTSPVELALGPSAPIFVDEQEQIVGEGAVLLQAFTGAVGRPLGEGKIRLVYSPGATSTTVFTALKLRAPDMLERNINNEGSMAGVISENGDQTPFFILSVASYGDTFAGMLAWEPSMIRALGDLYPPSQSVATDEAATTTASYKNQEGFSDQVVSNHDTRVYKDGSGKSVLIYGYWNQTTLLIARDESAFSALVARLATARSE